MNNQRKRHGRVSGYEIENLSGGREMDRRAQTDTEILQRILDELSKVRSDNERSKQLMDQRMGVMEWRLDKMDGINRSAPEGRNGKNGASRKQTSKPENDPLAEEIKQMIQDRNVDTDYIESVIGKIRKDHDEKYPDKKQRRSTPPSKDAVSRFINGDCYNRKWKNGDWKMIMCHSKINFLYKIIDALYPEEQEATNE